MDKKFPWALFVILVIIVYIGVVLLVCAIVYGIIMGCIALFKKYPKAVSRVVSTTMTPLLIIGWTYIGYTIYANDFCNTYIVEIRGRFNSNIPEQTYTVIAKSEEEVYIKAWKHFVTKNKDGLKANAITDYEGVLNIFNQSKMETCYPSFHNNIDSLIDAQRLYFRRGADTIDLVYISRGW